MPAGVTNTFLSLKEENLYIAAKNNQKYLITKCLLYRGSIVCISRLMVVSREAKEEVPCDGLSTNAREYFTRTNLDKIKNALTDKP